MPQQTELSFLTTEDFVSDIDFSEARNILDITTAKQKQIRRNRVQTLHVQVLLKRTYFHVCYLLNSDCSTKKALPLSMIDTNKRKLTLDHDNQVPSPKKRSTSLVENEIVQFLREINSVKVKPSDEFVLSSFYASKTATTTM